MSKNDWYEKKVLRSVTALKLWNENPRLNPDDECHSVTDYAESLLSEESEKKEFYDLLRSITRAYIPIDPIVVWKDESGKFCVAEGNRRVLVLKLLLNPDLAPKSIRSLVRSLANSIPEKIEKIGVYVAPSFEEVIWYINQRNNTSSMRKSWSRLQQFRWVSRLYVSYGGDVNRICELTNMTMAELEQIIRNLKLIDLVKEEAVKKQLSNEEYSSATSHQFPMTVLERFFSNSLVKERWGIEYEGTEILLRNKADFYDAFAAFVKNVVSTADERIRIDTRTITSELESILDRLPKVGDGVPEILTSENKKTLDYKEKQKKGRRTNLIKGDPNRTKIVLNNYVLKSANYRLLGIFDELKRLSPSAYSNAVAASLRIFLDLAVLEYIQTEGLESDICEKYHSSVRNITLKSRITFIGEKLPSSSSGKTIIARLMNAENMYSLDVLNGYQHNLKTEYLNRAFLNGFWDFLFPLFCELLDIEEKE